ncbi:alcohol dehydrogenase family protein [Brachybacterium sacelli]|uniref:NADPH:quinone reductase-like Zn-dependent oxidoreductase n=2 Tax=Brachybacterium sacelli TaxID=173364 RepID=A0ABS4WYQ2_9MICO|nr:alcohol dehydrogenase family protein [Brachybacterium sacelli]MBP2381329.1 NADPH:quinone reductase-like Zn-dependent oxidoreductase [Brachybacterium sacelli]
MSAVQLVGHGGLDQLVYSQSVRTPSPAAGEVLIDVHACGMNNTDVWVREGAYGSDTDPSEVSTWRRGRSTLEFPRIQGTDIVGSIVAVGDGVSEDRLGERVMVDFSIYNRPEGDESLADIDYIGHGRDGGYAEYVAVPSENAYEITADISDAGLATFCCAYLTAEQMLVRSRLAAGERVLVTGASGGVGSAIIQLARARGAIPYAVSSAGKEEALREIGAEDVILRDTEDLVAEVERVIDGPVDVVADLVAGPMFNDLLRILRPEGRYSTAGAIGGPVVDLDLRTMYLKQLELHGSSQGTRTAFRRLVDYIQDGTIRPLLDRTFPLSEFHEAQSTFMGKSYIGKLVVVPDRHWETVGAPYGS